MWVSCQQNVDVFYAKRLHNIDGGSHGRQRSHRFFTAPRLGEVAPGVRVRVRPDHRVACLRALDDALHGRCRRQGHDADRRAGAAPRGPPRHREAPGRHRLRAQRGRHPRRLLFAAQARRPRPGAEHQARQGSLLFRTDQGREICLAYRDVREACLMPGFTGSAGEPPHRRARPVAAHGIGALRPGRARGLHLPALNTGAQP